MIFCNSCVQYVNELEALVVADHEVIVYCARVQARAAAIIEDIHDLVYFLTCRLALAGVCDTDCGNCGARVS